MGKLKIYKIRDGYIRFLHGVDNKVQYNKNQRRPYVGIVLSIAGYNYFVPLESPKPNHANIKANVHIMRLDNGKYGLLGFNNMIPAKDHHLIGFDIASESDAAYRELLRNQLLFCQRHRQEIYEHAQKTYDAVVKKKSPFFVSICCDFSKLEEACPKYYYKTHTS